MPVQRQRLVLSQDVDLAQTRIDAVGERDIDNPVMPAERNSGFGAIARQRKQPLPGPARQQYAQRILHVHKSCPRSPMLFSNSANETNVAIRYANPLQGAASSIAPRTAKNTTPGLLGDEQAAVTLLDTSQHFGMLFRIGERAAYGECGNARIDRDHHEGTGEQTHRPKPSVV